LWMHRQKIAENRPTGAATGTAFACEVIIAGDAGPYTP